MPSVVALRRWWRCRDCGRSWRLWRWALVIFWFGIIGSASLMIVLILRAVHRV